MLVSYPAATVTPSHCPGSVPIATSIWGTLLWQLVCTKWSNLSLVNDFTSEHLSKLKWCTGSGFHQTDGDGDHGSHQPHCLLGPSPQFSPSSTYESLLQTASGHKVSSLPEIPTPGKWNRGFLSCCINTCIILLICLLAYKA